MALGDPKTMQQWIDQYEQSHQHPMNRLCHTLGIPIVISSVLLAIASLIWHPLLWAAGACFVVGWTFQFVGHAYEKKPPEFFRDWRFLLVGARWWLQHISGARR
jgi:uncharacterized membrane protein YGL010W